MRKIISLTLLALMLASIVTTQAQEKQNDATWEETIGFLQKYLTSENVRYIWIGAWASHDCKEPTIYITSKSVIVM